MERRKISKEVYDKIIKQIPNKIIEMLPDKPENLLRYATRIKEVQFSKNVDEPTKKLMKENLLKELPEMGKNLDAIRKGTNTELSADISMAEVVNERYGVSMDQVVEKAI